ncbi:hypothetical protein NPIL_359801 [Nephila pilipes]|uniref:Uncharacterized protein n=1 Tax=Nephila pilipes TaxID=299642 RepID=A0A8X6UB64_NEPPI|nr:hypothetical protein NPIL_359801 [Nephila pilipes]
MNSDSIWEFTECSNMAATGQRKDIRPLLQVRGDPLQKRKWPPPIGRTTEIQGRRWGLPSTCALLQVVGERSFSSPALTPRTLEKKREKRMDVQLRFLKKESALVELDSHVASM